MRVFLNVTLVLITFFSCYLESIYLSVLSPQPARSIPFTVRSHRYLEFDQEEALGSKRTIALSQYVPLYTYVPDMAEKAVKKVGTLTEMAFTLKDLNLTGGEEFVRYLHEEFGLELRRESAAKLLRYPNLKNLLAGILTVEESILQNKIVEDPEPFAGKGSIEVLYPEPSGIVAHPTKEIITLEEARLTLEVKVNQLFWQLDKGLLDPLVQISLATLLPNLRYDQKENDKRIKEIIQRFPSKVVAYKPGDILVPFRKVLGDKDVLLLSVYQAERKKDFYENAPWILIAILFMVGFYSLFLSKILWAGWRKKPPCRLLLSSLIITILLVKACLLFTTFPIFVVPFAFLPLLIILLHNERVSAACTTVMAAILVSLFSGRTFEILLFFTLAGVVAVLVPFNRRKRIHVFVPSLVVGIINVVIVMAFLMEWESVAGHVFDWQKIEFSSLGGLFGSSLLENMGWAFVGGFGAGPVAILLLPLMEVGGRTASTFKLNRYADLQHPIMKSLLTKAPATYQHTMTVAYLAGAVGEAIGADTLLLRIGAYYHDIGKVEDPKFFSENQSSGENPHDTLHPQESAEIIINHVKYGKRLGREYGLPEVVVDFIAQHHGTQLMEYFYNKAVKRHQTSKPRKEDFRYPGPKPQSVEAAILMIVDAVEAASRSMEEPTREKIENMIRLLIVKRIADGQFADCNLSTRYLAKIVQILVDCLEASLHSRVTYPWQEREKDKGVVSMEERSRLRSISSG